MEEVRDSGAAVLFLQVAIVAFEASGEVILAELDCTHFSVLCTLNAPFSELHGCCHM